jgi:hypothetical protein
MFTLLWAVALLVVQGKTPYSVDDGESLSALCTRGGRLEVYSVPGDGKGPWQTEARATLLVPPHDYDRNINTEVYEYSVVAAVQDRAGRIHYGKSTVVEMGHDCQRGVLTIGPTPVVLPEVRGPVRRVSLIAGARYRYGGEEGQVEVGYLDWPVVFRAD